MTRDRLNEELLRFSSALATEDASCFVRLLNAGRSSPERDPKYSVTHPYLEDQALMQCIADGDAAAFRKLSQEHLRAIVTFAYRILNNSAEAEDVAQETFLRAWQKAGNYEPRARVSTWLHTIARNLALDRLRRRATRGNEFVVDDERDASPFSERPSQLLLKKEVALTVQDALTRLPERQRIAILLCHEQGHSNPEISAVLECSIEAVESLLSRGRRQLRKLLENDTTRSSQVAPID